VSEKVKNVLRFAVDCALILSIIGLAVIGLQKVNNHRVVLFSPERGIRLEPKDAPVPSADATIEELQANPNVTEIFCDEPDPNGAPGDMLWTDWTPRRGYIHYKTPHKQGV